jgi:hypothetical protein
MTTRNAIYFIRKISLRKDKFEKRKPFYFIFFGYFTNIRIVAQKNINGLTLSLYNAVSVGSTSVCEHTWQEVKSS